VVWYLYVFPEALVVAISHALRHTRVLVMAVHCWRVVGCPIRTWNLSSFIPPVSLFTVYLLRYDAAGLSQFLAILINSIITSPFKTTASLIFCHIFSR